MTHYDEDDILSYLHGRPGTPRGIAEHLLACPECRTTLEELRSLAADLVRADVPAAIRAYEERRQVEDARAEEQLSREGLPRQGTLGTVRACLRRAHELLDQHPLDASRWADAGCAIAFSIPTANYPPGVVAHARGDAYRESANALRMLGKIPEALERLEVAAQCYGETYTAAYPLAHVAFARALVHYTQSDYARAEREITECSAAFREFGDTASFVKAQLMAAAILFGQGAIDQAARIFASLVQPLEESGDEETLARVYSNLGSCSVALGEATSAEAYFIQAMRLFEERGMNTEKLRVRWNLARLTLQRQPEESLRPLQEVRVTFETLGMRMDAALVGLDMVEALLITGDELRAERLAVEVLLTLQREQANLKATIALTYLQTAMQARRATPSLARYVREYVENPTSAFQPPA